LKQWVQKLLQQFDSAADNSALDVSEERATLLFMIDAYSKHLIEVDARPTRKVRAIFDEFAKGLLKLEGPHTEKLLFRFRQFFSAYRIEEYSYLQKTFEDFKGIIWDFADQLNESVQNEQARDVKVRESLNHLKEAVEANSIQELKAKSREFIDFYIELQSKTEEKRSQRLVNVQKNLAAVKQRLVEVREDSKKDHLTGAFNRKHFDETLPSLAARLKSHHEPSTLLALDIDYFKKINDIFGHDTGDHVLKEFVRILNDVFNRETDVVARVGGEEFAVLLQNTGLVEGVKRAEEALNRVRKEVIVFHDVQVRFTISIGVAQLGENEDLAEWVKRADAALYKSKNGGRDRCTVSPVLTRSNVA
jgi:diguanylate cyclase